MTFSDIFKSDFLGDAASFSAAGAAVAFGSALALSLFILWVYKRTFKGVMYSQSFGISLIAMTLITTLIILAVTSNIILSLGMVGALSIVRFRSAVKEPIDIAFIFWSISTGIVLGAGLILLAVTGSLFIGVILILFLNKKSADDPYILVINCENELSELDVMSYISGKVKKQTVRSKSVSPSSGIELTVEIRLRDTTTRFVNDIAGIKGINNVVLVSYNGEYMS